MTEIYTQAQRCRIYFGRNWLERIHPALQPENILPKKLMGAPSRPSVLSLHIRHHLGRMARS